MDADKTCCECGQKAARLRRERCDACYMRLYRGGDVAEGACCAGCGERRRDLLCVESVGEESAVVCGNCALVLRKVRPRLGTLADLKRRRQRDRRGVATPPGHDEPAAERRASDVMPVRPAFDVSVD